MPTAQLQRLGVWVSISGVVLTLVYLFAVAGMFMFADAPFGDPYVSMISIVTLVTAPGLVFLWSILHEVVTAQQKLFTRTSLLLIVVFATLTSINRYVALTVVPQSQAMNNTNGLAWFLPYGWPSIMAAIEVLAWGFFFGLALLFLAPVFRTGRLERTLFWTLVISGSLSLVAVLGQILDSAFLNMLGVLAWGPGLMVFFVLLAIWFKHSQ
jgi:hypothetical protein